ncbi:MAG TPA: hypothetical protein VFC82_11350 [Actinomycetaceae bacterium]|nr:hypothetical protein [Actinomycetaceae bacterium]
MLATLDAHIAGLHHLLVLDPVCAPEDVAALARSRYPEAAWASQDELILEEHVALTGPWSLDDGVRRDFDLPAWAAQAWVCLVPQVRSGELPLGLIGTDPLLDAYPQAVPHGVEMDTLRFLQAAARRLGGAVHLAGTNVVFLPDPQSAVDLTVYSPDYLSPEAMMATIEREDAQIDGRMRRSWSISMPARPGDPDSGLIQIIHERQDAPFAISGLDWAGHSRGTEIRWHPPEDMRGRLRRAQRYLRRDVIHQVEALARAAVDRTGGVPLDDDGFIVAL